jgi:hypothetical protein
MMMKMALTKAEREKVADLMQRLLDLLDHGYLDADGPTGVALVKRLEGAMLALRVLDSYGTRSRT